MPRVVYFATGNKHKFAEVTEILRDFPINFERIDAKGKEIQSDSIEEIAEESATNAASKTKLSIFVEDTGLFIKHLRGFPGPYAAYAHKTIGLQGILALMKDAPTREAHFRSAIAFASPSLKTVIFQGEVVGTIATTTRGNGGFGYDPIFEPLGGEGRTFGEMSLSEKNRLSHRALAAKKFVEWYIAK
jgi:XTP/dITP diphosphohydrolase